MTKKEEKVEAFDVDTLPSVCPVGGRHMGSVLWVVEPAGPWNQLLHLIHREDERGQSYPITGGARVCVKCQGVFFLPYKIFGGAKVEAKGGEEEEEEVDCEHGLANCGECKTGRWK